MGEPERRPTLSPGQTYLDNLDALVGHLEGDLEGLLAPGSVDEIGQHRVDHPGAPQSLRLLGAQEPDIVGGLLDVPTQAQRHLLAGMCDVGTLNENAATLLNGLLCSELNGSFR